MAVEDGRTVRVHYRGTLDDGSEFDSSEGKQPIEFKVGEGQVIQGFEQAVRGLDSGDSTTVRLEAEDAYGPRYDEAVQVVPKELFYEEPTVDSEVEVVGPDGGTMRARITDVAGEEVSLDFNHPLAGEALTFEIELVDIVEES